MPKLGEALGRQKQLADDEHGPTLPDDVEGSGNPTGVPIATAGWHGHLLVQAVPKYHEGQLFFTITNGCY